MGLDISAIIVALIVAIPSVMTTILTNRTKNAKTEAKIDTISSDVAELKEDVKAHNNYSLRINTLETELTYIKAFIGIGKKPSTSSKKGKKTDD